MARYASGRYAWGYSDRSGFRYRLKDMRKEWNGLFVGKDEFESKHPQIDLRVKNADAEARKDERPDRAEHSVSVLLPFNPFKTGTGGSSPTTVTVTEPAHGRSASSTVRFRDVAPFDGISSSTMQGSSGFTIQSVVDTNRYTISVSATATLGNVFGGGGVASAGPVTLES